jgi:hypothetical protein
MEVSKISATLRHSKEIGGSWKSLEISAEASVDPGEDWQVAQATLYAQLARQFKTLWSQNGTTPHAQDVSESHQIDAQAPVPDNHTPIPAEGAAQTPDHYCQEHNQAFKAKEGKYGTFFSHKAPDGSWCNEPRG